MVGGGGAPRGKIVSAAIMEIGGTLVADAASRRRFEDGS
jgi:hypothetical protein